MSRRPAGARDDNRPTEDDIARERLGGVKGSPNLPPAEPHRQETANSERRAAAPAGRPAAPEEDKT